MILKKSAFISTRVTPADTDTHAEWKSQNRIRWRGNEITLPEKTETPTTNRLEINILRLKKSTDGALKLDRANNPVSVRQGRRNQNTGQQQRRNGTQNVMPGCVRMPKSGSATATKLPQQNLKIYGK